MEPFVNGIYTFILKIQPLGWILAVCDVIIIGVMFGLGEESRTKAKKWAPWVIVSVGLIAGAIIIGKEISAAFAF